MARGGRRDAEVPRTGCAYKARRTGRRTGANVVGQVSGSMVLARESRDQASVAQRSRSSLAGVFAGGLMPASLRNWMRSAGDGRGLGGFADICEYSRCHDMAVE